MIIGLYNLEPKIENTALMQVSFYHKSKGDQVELYNPFIKEKYDLVYAFSIFDFTPKHYINDKMICGGSGFDVKQKLPLEIENSDLDYSIFPKCRTSYLWFSRGCIRTCPWCIVSRKEGRIRSAIPKNLNPRGDNISIMDNNFFANPDYLKAIDFLRTLNQPVNFQQGIDIRLMDNEKWKNLLSLRHLKQIRSAWDNPQEDLRSYFLEALKYVSPYKLMVYVLIGFNSTEEEDLFRVKWLNDQNIDPYVMPFNKFDPYQRSFRKWVNRKALLNSVSWEEFKKNKAFCQ